MGSCMDDRYPAENMLDGKDNTFWITTGMFPQEFVVAMAKPVQVSQIVVLALNGAALRGGKGETPCMLRETPCAHALATAQADPFPITVGPAVKKLSVERCETDSPSSFEKVFEVDLQNREGRLQTERHQVNIKAKFLKFTLLSGYAEFATVNRWGRWVSDRGEGGQRNPREQQGMGGGKVSDLAQARPRLPPPLRDSPLTSTLSSHLSCFCGLQGVCRG